MTFPVQIQNDPPKNPKKLSKEETDMKKIRKYYLDKTVKRSPSSLETIFEEPVDEKLMSSRKSSRVINFNRTTTALKLKSRKRQLKAKTELKFVKRKWKKISVDLLMDTLSILEQQEQKEESNQVTKST